MKLKSSLLFITILVLLAGVAAATDVSADTTDADTPTSDTLVLEKALQKKQSVSQGDTDTVENIKQKTDTNQTKNIEKTTGNNLKKDTTVDSWTTLNNTITEATQDTTITLTKKTYTVTGRIDFNKAITITIDGNGSTIDGNQKQVFYINSGSSVILKNITIINAKNTGGYGGAIDNGGNLTIINSTLKNNTANYGGAINNNNGNITIIDSNITQNTATGQNDNGVGGAIYNNEGGTLNITQSNLTHNTATGQENSGWGGAIYNGGTLNITQSNLTQNTATGQGQYGYGLGGAIYNGGTLTLTQSNLTQNTATGQQTIGYGGAIYNGGTLTITQSNLTQNKATGQGQDGYGVGGAIYNSNRGNLTITESNLTQNNATGQINGVGGAIYNWRGNLTITQSNLTQNNATGQGQYGNGIGGAICNDYGTINITQSNLNNNTATGQRYGYGGAIYTQYGNLNINDSILEYNNATNGGAINNYNGNITLNNTNLTYNNASEYGGAINNNGTRSNLTIITSNLTHNTATGQENSGWGGAIYNNGTLTITDSNLTQNTATGQTYDGVGGAIYNNGGTLTITQTNLTQNTANGQTNARGGAIYNIGGGTTTISNTLFYNNAPANFIINQDNHIELTTNDNYITVSTFTIIEDEKQVYQGTMENLGEYTVSPDSLNVKLIVNDTDTNSIDNVFILRKIKEVNITCYDELVNAIKDAQEEQYDKHIINLKPGNYNANQNITWNESATRNIIINGNGQTLDGQNTYQFIQIAEEHNLTLTNITITNYAAEMGGAIYNSGTLTITQSNLTQNTANGQNGYGGAIYNTGTLTITQSNLTQNNATGQEDGRGGAIYNTGTLTITHSNLTQNTATGQQYNGYGGAIYNQGGTLNITQTNLTQNTATGQTYGFGGAIYNSGNLTITQSNLTQNTATGQTSGYGGAIYDYSTSILTNITSSNFINNTAPHGAAICASGNVSFTSNTFKENTATNNKETIDLNGYWNGIHEGNNYEYTDIALNEIKLSIKDDQDTFLEGEEVVLNYSIQLTNPTHYWDFETAINDITLYINNEKNKTTRYENITLTDLQPGTYEIYYTTCNRQSNKVTFTVYYPDTECNVTNYTQLVQAIENATNNPYTNYKINLQPGNYNATQSINWENSATRKITINGNEQTLNGQNTYQFIKIAQEHNLTLTNITITNYTAEEGGAIYNTGNLTINNSTLTQNKATGQQYGRGGAIYNNGGTLTITGSNLTHNKATGQIDGVGGAIYNYRGAATVYNNIFTNNLAKSATGNAIIDEGRETSIHDNINADSSKYSSTIYTNNVIGDEVYPVSITFNTFDDEPRNTSIIISTNNTTIPTVTDMINITLELKDDFNLPVTEETITVLINEKETTVTTDSSGMASMEYQVMSNETLINATYHGKKDTYNENNTVLTLLAEKIETKLLVDDISTAVGKTFTINGTLLDINDKPVKEASVNITVNGSTKTATTNTTGQFNITFTLDQMGEYPITTVFYENNGYKESTNNTAKVTASKTDTKLTLEVSNTTPINNTVVTITANLTDINNNPLINQPVTITIDDEVFNINTNENGIINKEYTTHEVGKQNITVTYNGNNMYNANSTTTDINVYKIDTKLTLTVSNSTPINSTNITITTTLTDTNGNKLANQNITITTDEETFNLKTNNEGIVTQTYTPTTLGTQTITATYKGDSQYVNSTTTTNITVKKINTKIDLKVSNNTPINNTPITITVTLTDTEGNKLVNQQVTLNINGKTVTAKTNNNGIVTQNYTPTKVETQNITATYKGDSQYNNSTKTIQISVKNKIKTKTTVNPATGVIGEKLIIKATVTDTNGNNVNEGNLIFKVNGVTIKDNGKLTGSSNPLKIKIVNGVATATIIPDINMTNAKNITAYYVGTTIYNASTSSPASMNISKRNATIEVTTNKKIIKQGQVLTITAKIYDTTNGKKTSNITRYQDEYVYFKVNGITLKDANGEMLKVKIINGTATVNYTIPLGISCVMDTQSMIPKNHTIQVGLYNKNYQNIMTKTPTFQVERSNITINIANATINNKTHTLSMKITIKDYLKNTVAGPNKLVIKVNGLTLKNGTNVQYYYTTDGVLNLKNIPIPTAKNYTSIEVITQDRLAYNSQRNTTKVIKITS